MIKQPTCFSIACDVCGYVLDEDDEGIYHFATGAMALEVARNLGWWATESAIICNDGEGEHNEKAAEIAQEIAKVDSTGKRTSEFLTWCEKTGHVLDAPQSTVPTPGQVDIDGGAALAPGDWVRVNDSANSDHAGSRGQIDRTGCDNGSRSVLVALNDRLAYFKPTELDRSGVNGVSE